MQVLPASVILWAIGTTQQFSAEATDADGNLLSGISFSWSSSNTAVATVDSDGLATAQDEGSAQIIATADGVADSASLTVDTSSSEGDLPAVVLPSASDWTDHGEVIALGSSGEWDHRIDGAFNVVGMWKDSDGTLYLYYIGASGDRTSDGGPADREVGVATSDDGLSFTKHESNPLISYQPNGAEEEGIFSGGMWADGETIYLMAGAMEQVGSNQVDGSGDLYTSADGINWSVDTRNVLDPTSTGDGNDERFPFAAYESGGTHHVYYSAKGSDVTNWQATHVSGASWAGLKTYTDLGFGYMARAGGQVIKKSASTYLLSISDATNEVVRVYTFDPAHPTSLTQQTTWDYSIFGMTATRAGNQDNGLLYLDRNLETWFFFYITGSGPDGTGIHVATAPMELQ